jgi:hypothetical protein
VATSVAYSNSCAFLDYAGGGRQGRPREEAVVGTNKRYADHYDGLMDARILERTAATAGPLQSLTDAELELDTEPLTIAPQPHPVRAWVRFGSTAVRVDAEACRWTERAVGIRFTAGGRELRTWVWSSVVTPKVSEPHAAQGGYQDQTLRTV